MADDATFDVLHVLRLKGIVDGPAIAAALGGDPVAAERTVTQLVEAGFVRSRETPRLSGWTLTEAGRQRHAEAMTASRSPENTAALAPLYERFLALNNRVKALATSWQQLSGEDATGRWEAIEELAEVHAEAARIVGAMAEVVERFAWHSRRLAAAMERLREGDERYFTGVTVDSFHTVWFECHEDLIQTLGRERIAEGSF
jgi:hypothetical protein